MRCAGEMGVSWVLGWGFVLRIENSFVDFSRFGGLRRR